jgi:hypothetical protein
MNRTISKYNKSKHIITNLIVTIKKSLGLVRSQRIDNDGFTGAKSYMCVNYTLVHYDTGTMQNNNIEKITLKLHHTFIAL